MYDHFPSFKPNLKHIPNKFLIEYSQCHIRKLEVWSCMHPFSYPFPKFHIKAKTEDAWLTHHTKSCSWRKINNQVEKGNFNSVPCVLCCICMRGRHRYYYLGIWLTLHAWMNSKTGFWEVSTFVVKCSN